VTLTWPLALLAVAVVPAAAAAYALLERRRARYAVRFTNVDVLASLASPVSPWRRYLPPALLLLALAAALVALARPQVAHSVQREQATVVLVIDTSGSMVANDVPPTRLVAATRALRRFLDVLPRRYQVGIVTFASEPRVVTPVTSDRLLASQGLEHLRPFGGTALGDAIARGVALLRPSSAARSRAVPAAIVLLSDGAQNRGQLEPLRAAGLARQLRIPVFTVALGTAGGTISIAGSAAADVVKVPVPPDPETLRDVANTTGGRFYAATSSARLTTVYEGLASQLATKREYREATFVLLAASAFFVVAGGVLSALWAPRLP
jgi:Ca-activated chloride channel family protein